MMIKRHWDISFLVWAAFSAIFRDVEMAIVLGIILSLQLMATIADEFLKKPPFTITIGVDSETGNLKVDIEAFEKQEYSQGASVIGDDLLARVFGSISKDGE